MAPASFPLLGVLAAGLLASVAGQAGIALPANSQFPPGVTSNPFGEVCRYRAPVTSITAY